MVICQGTSDFQSLDELFQATGSRLSLTIINNPDALGNISINIRSYLHCFQLFTFQSLTVNNVTHFHNYVTHSCINSAYFAYKNK